MNSTILSRHSLYVTNVFVVVLIFLRECTQFSADWELNSLGYEPVSAERATEWEQLEAACTAELLLRLQCFVSSTVFLYVAKSITCDVCMYRFRHLKYFKLIFHSFEKIPPSNKLFIIFNRYSVTIMSYSFPCKKQKKSPKPPIDIYYWGHLHCPPGGPFCPV